MTDVPQRRAEKLIADLTVQLNLKCKSKIVIASSGAPWLPPQKADALVVLLSPDY